MSLGVRGQGPRYLKLIYYQINLRKKLLVAEGSGGLAPSNLHYLHYDKGPWGPLSYTIIEVREHLYNREGGSGGPLPPILLGNINTRYFK